MLPLKNVRRYHFRDVAKYKKISPKESKNMKKFWSKYLLFIKRDVAMVTALIKKLTINI